MKITIYAQELDNVAKILDKISNKAKRYEVPMSYEIGIPYYKKIRLTKLDSISNQLFEVGKIMVEAIDIDITGEVIHAKGWSVIAHIEHLEEGKNIVTLISHHDNILDDWFTVKGNCDHCKTNRKRSKTYIVKNESGEFKQVGRSCLRDYTGIHPELAIMWASLQDIILDEKIDFLNSKIIGFPTVYTVSKVIATALEEISINGYRKDGITKEEVLKKISSTNYEPKNESLAITSLIEDMVNREDAEGMDWFCSDYINNAKAIVSSGYCKSKHFGRLVYLPEVFRKVNEAREALRKREGQVKISNYFGNVGDKIKINVTSINLVASYDNAYGGFTKIWKIVDEFGNVFVWKTGNNCEGTIIQGTIKEHNEYNGEKQTVLTRCKIIK